MDGAGIIRRRSPWEGRPWRASAARPGPGAWPPGREPAGRARGPWGPWAYLQLYNTVQLCAWILLLDRAVAAWSTGGSAAVWPAVARLFVLAQTAAVAELAHAAAGLVRAPLRPTLTQLLIRLTIAWGLLGGPRGLVACRSARLELLRLGPSATFGLDAATLMIALAITEIIRYSHFAWQGVVRVGGADFSDLRARRMAAGLTAALTWLRYSSFLVLYPLGGACEVWLSLAALPELTGEWHPSPGAPAPASLAGALRRAWPRGAGVGEGISRMGPLATLHWVYLVLYIAANAVMLPTLYLHLLRQRRRALAPRGKLQAA